MTKTVVLKFYDEIESERRVTRLKSLREAVPGTETRLLFPGISEDDELATLFEITLSHGIEAKQVISFLEQMPEVEYAHEPATRRGLNRS